MKKLLVLLIAFLSIATLKAQENGILYTNYDPDFCREANGVSWDYSFFEIDFDQDGTIDFKMGIYAPYSDGWPEVGFVSLWPYRLCHGSNDTILSDYSFYAANPTYIDHYFWDEGQTHEAWIGFCKTVDDKNYYAWAWFYFERGYLMASCCCDEVAYCTIPDYPLRWGQTSMEWDVDENNGPSFADIQPNPTNGEIAITGKDLKKAEVFNSVGQQVVSAQCQGERLTFDLGNQPAGLYFVSVTDTNGRRCVKKVVKQ